MSCISSVGPPATMIFPVPVGMLVALQDSGHAAITGRWTLTEYVQHVGTCSRADGKPFYLTTCAPEGDRVDPPWTGGFYAPFGSAVVLGSVALSDGPYADTVTLAVTALLVAGDTTLVAASWTVNGMKGSVRATNRAAIIGTVTVTNPGPHQSADIAACIRRHAPERALAAPHELVALQCGVAVSSFIEAIC